LLVTSTVLLVACDARERPGISAFTVGTGADQSPSGAFQARLGVYPLNANVAEPLTHLGFDFQVEPLLATHWEYRGANTWRFHLRQGVFFHDGQPFTSRAVVESIANVVRARGGYSGLGEHSVVAVDDSTVDITPEVPNLHLPQQLVHPNYAIFAPGSKPAVFPVGTGPYKWVEYVPYQRVVVRRSENYRGPPPRIEEISFRFIPDANTRALALFAGELDLAMDFPREQIDEVARDARFRIARSAAGQSLTFQINSHGRAPHDLLRDRRLRHAVAHAIDQSQLIRDLWRNEAAPLNAMTVPAILGEYARRLRGIAFDTIASNRLLEESGWKRGRDGIRIDSRGRPLRLEMLASVEVETGAIELLQAQMRRVGIDAQFTRTPDPGALSARLTAGDFDLNLAISNQNDADPMFLPALLFYSRSKRPFARWYAAGPKFDSIVAAGLATYDPNEMRRLAAEAMRVAVEEEAVCIPVAALFRIYSLRSDVGGFAPHPSQTNQSWTTLWRNK
jgi:peptide/nickel transport system substrate-binding protein